MPININDYVSFNATQAKNDSHHGSNKANTATINNTQTDSVKLTKIATKLQALEQQISDSPVIDQKHIDRLKNDINNNQFKFDDKQLAEKIFQVESSLNGVRR